MRSTVMGVGLNGLTTIAGFGSLLVAHHRGVWSLGLLLVIVLRAPDPWCRTLRPTRRVC